MIYGLRELVEIRVLAVESFLLLLLCVAVFGEENRVIKGQLSCFAFVQGRHFIIEHLGFISQ